MSRMQFALGRVYFIAYMEEIKQKLDTCKSIKKIVGIVCIILGLLALFTPLTPGSWLIPIGLELVGIRLAFYEKIKEKVKTWF